MGTQLPSPKRGQSPLTIFGPFPLWPKGWMHQDVTWYGARPQSTVLCVRWGHSPLPKKGAEPPPNFRPCLLWPNGWMYQDGTCHVGRPRPRPHCARWGPRSPSPEKGAQPPIFGPCPLWLKAGCIRIPLGMEVGLNPGDIVRWGTQLRPLPASP